MSRNASQWDSMLFMNKHAKVSFNITSHFNDRIVCFDDLIGEGTLRYVYHKEHASH